MSEQTMKILRMLEDGKITAAEATELLAKVEELEEEESEPEPRPHPQHNAHHGMPDLGNIPVPPIPQIPDIGKTVDDAVREALSAMPDIGKIVDDALRKAFSSMPDIDKIVNDALREALSSLPETFPSVSFGDEDDSAETQTAHAEEGVTVGVNIEEPPAPPEPHRYSEESDLGESSVT